MKLISWTVDLTRVDPVGVDLVRVDLAKFDLAVTHVIDILLSG